MVEPSAPTVMTASVVSETKDDGGSKPRVAPSALFRIDQATTSSIDDIIARFDSAASLGFDAILLASPFAADGKTPGDPTALRRLADAAHERDLSLCLDLCLDRIAPDAPLVSEHPDWFVHAVDGVAFCFLSETDAAVDWWDEQIMAWQADGLDGLYLQLAQRLPAQVATRLIDAARNRRPDFLVIATTFGAVPSEIAALDSCGFDFAVSSSCWWDGRAPWLTEDIARVAAIGRVATLVVPPGAGISPAERWTIGIAGFLGNAWIMNAPPQENQHDLIRAVNRMRRTHRAVFAAMPELVSPPGGPTTLIGRFDPRGGGLVLAFCASGTGVDMQRLRAWLGDRCGGLEPIDLPDADGTIRLFRATPLRIIKQPARARPKLAAAVVAPRIAIEAVSPAVDGGQFPVKRIVGERVDVAADLICDGHGRLAADLLWRSAEQTTWRRTPMTPLGNDRWTAGFDLDALGRSQYTIEVWVDRFGAFADEIAKKHAANVRIDLELIEGAALIEAAIPQASEEVASVLRVLLEQVNGSAADSPTRDEQVLSLTAPATIAMMREAETRQFLLRLEPAIPVDAERRKAGFASWYEIFPRSQSQDEARHGNFDDVIAALPRICAMGFDVLYFPPIHPIGRKNRKGRNNSLTPSDTDPGSPYAIGSAEGGHDAIHAELGTLEDFQRLLAAATEHGLEIALDFAIQCAPDHPWLREHPEWFDWRPDGTIKYAENPPKKYEDIVNVDFYADGATPSLWAALRDVVAFWVEQGVRIFRVDNPHTKPLAFWAWMIADIRSRNPDVMFLAEAFTRPKVMYRLGKIGFSQSYTYFTWRNTAAEMRDYVTELTTTAPRDFFRPHFFVNTPDINPVFLQSSGRPGFMIRAALAATLSGLWGVYNGFELCEGQALPGREEYVDSEKYQIRAWDYDRPGNIIAEITALNRIRKQNPALHSHLGVTFLPCSNDQILYFEKADADRSNVILVAISFDPFNRQTAEIDLPLSRCGLDDTASLEAEDLARGIDFVWHGKRQIVSLDPYELPYCIWRITP